MSQWGTSDASSNSVIWAPTSVMLTPNTSNRDSLYGNTTADAFVTGATVGMFAADDGELAASLGSIAHSGWILRTAGSGGRAGRVMTEVLVAGGISSDNNNDDVVVPDYVIRISTQPADATANSSVPDEAVFSVVAATVPTGGSLSYNWTYANGGSIQAGANVGVTTTSTLTVNSGVETSDVDYKVTVSVAGGANVTSSNASLTVTT